MANKTEKKCLHKYVTRIKKTPLCKREGIRIYICVKCRHEYSEIIPAKGHSYQEDENGEMRCTRCGALKKQ